MYKRILVLLIIIFFYIGFIVYSDFDKFINSIFKFQMQFLIPIFGLLMMGVFVSGIKQQLLLKSSGIIIPFKKSLLLYMAGLSMEITPGGVGKLIKSYYLKEKYGYDFTKSFPIIILERFYDLIAVTLIIIFTLFFIQSIEVAIIISIVVAFIIGIYFTINSKSFFDNLSKLFSKIPFFNKFINSVNESYEIFQNLTTKKNLLVNSILSIVANVFYAFSIYFVFLGFNVNYDVIFTTFITLSSVLFGVLTFLPAGIGITEVSVVGFLTNNGIDLSLATSIMIIIRLVTTWFITLVGFITTKLFLK